jgi:transketolase
MGLEDLASFRALHGSTVLYPCDANQTARLTAAMADLPGIRYLRTTRGNTPVIYRADEVFPVGGSKTPRQSDADEVTIIAAGITLHEALAAADRLAEEDGIRARVIDLYSVKPADTAVLRAAAERTGRFVTVEDHRPEGGLGDAVVEAFDGGQPPLMTRLAVRIMPDSAKPEEQLRAAGIDAQAIAEAARELVRTREE